MRREDLPDLLRTLQGEVERVRELLAGGRQNGPTAAAALTTARAEELVDEIRAAGAARERVGVPGDHRSRLANQP